MKYHMALFLALVATVGCGHRLPPASRLMHPGPGVDGPGPGVIPPQAGYMGGGPGGSCMIDGGGGAGGVGYGVSQVHFVGPEGMHVQWSMAQEGMFDSEPLVTPARYNFGRGAIYRLKLANVPGYEGEVFYPTLEVGPALPRTEAYLAHNAIPVQFTQEDLDQVLTGNFVTKVIYLPDAEFQELAIAGVETLVSTRLDPGVDPIIEADRRGSILGIVRIGNKLIEEVGGEQEGGMVAGPGMGAGYQYAQWGMPMSGTPIGLPGPPHVPLGGPAGLKKHTMRNHTLVRTPEPTRRVHVSATEPPQSYPRPASRTRIFNFGF